MMVKGWAGRCRGTAGQSLVQRNHRAYPPPLTPDLHDGCALWGRLGWGPLGLWVLAQKSPSGSPHPCPLPQGEGARKPHSTSWGVTDQVTAWSAGNLPFSSLSLRTEPVPDLIRESAIHGCAGEKSWIPGRARDDSGGGGGSGGWHRGALTPALSRREREQEGGIPRNASYFLLPLRTEPAPDSIRESAVHDPAGGAATPPSSTRFVFFIVIADLIRNP